MRIDDIRVLEAEGISAAHVQCFLAIAKQEDCVILTRTPGAACLLPLAEGYDAKGFHIKGKSCNWGPMAGFLCAEPLFNKSGVDGALDNAKAHLASLTVPFGREGTDITDRVSRLVPLEISEARRLWLEKAGATMRREGDGYRGTTTIGADASKVELRWALVPVAGAARWRVFHDPASLVAATAAVEARLAAAISAATAAKDARAISDATADADKFRRYREFIAGPLAQVASPTGLAGYKPVLALTNPHRAYTAAGETYRNAVTGDFDLFAVWPRQGREADFRVRVGGMQPGVDLDAQKRRIYAAEAADAIGRVAGNISNGLYMIGQMINSVMVDPQSKVQVNRVFHSDEGGRPGMKTVDSSVAFTPSGEVHSFSDGALDFPEFILRCDAERFVVFLNAGWIAPLGATAARVSAAVQAAWQAFVPRIAGQAGLPAA